MSRGSTGCYMHTAAHSLCLMKETHIHMKRCENVKSLDAEES